MGKIIKGENDLVSIRPDLLNEWNYEKNEGINPEELTIGSNKKVWWKCKKGHEWINSINHRVGRNQGCPYCSGRYAIAGENDIETTHPELLLEWDYEKNENIIPSAISYGSSKKVWWRCQKGHSWQASISKRTIEKTNCPYCCNQKVLIAYNDLATTHPELVEDWNYEKTEFLPTEVIAGGDRKVWWKCSKCGYEWESQVKVRARMGGQCPNCMKYHATSFPEQALFFYLQQKNLNVINRAIVHNIELDIYLPDLQIGIEYDGHMWHKNSFIQDENKDSICYQNHIKLIRIREKGLKKTSLSINFVRNDKSYIELDEIIIKLFNVLNIESPIIDTKKDRNSIIAKYIIKRENDSFGSKFPELIDEWDYEKNNPLTPFMVAPYFNEKVWWKCSKCKNEWQAKVSNRTVEKSGCPICGRKMIGETRRKNLLKKGGSFSYKFPELLKEWDYEKNTLSPEEVTFGSPIKVWWKCEKGHSWESSVNTRTSLKVGCPYCAGKRAISGETDLATTHSKLLEEWDYNKNNVLPNSVMAGTGLKVWWKCEKGHSYEASISKRTLRNQGCPYCSGKRVLKGFNDLETTCIDLIKEWNYEKNELLPENYSKGSHEKVWWRCCKCGSEWEAPINARSQGKYKCPTCK